MTGRQFYDWQTAGGGGDVLRLVEALEREEIPWCMIGGLAVNHWAEEPIATADVDLVIATGLVEEAVRALEEAGFQSERFPWSVNLKGRSKVSVQISTDEAYRDFPSRSVAADVHGILMRVAALEDTLQGKILAWRDPQRRPSKRQKDLLDVFRLVEAHPELQAALPPDLAERVRQDLSRPGTIAILPAAGASSRMGRPKLLLPYRGTTIAGSLVASLRAAGVETIVLVLAPGDEALAAWCRGEGLATAVNPAPGRGMLSSIQAGIAAVFDGSAVETLLVSPADLPAIRSETISR